MLDELLERDGRANASQFRRPRIPASSGVQAEPRRQPDGEAGHDPLRDVPDMPARAEQRRSADDEERERERQDPDPVDARDASVRQRVGESRNPCRPVHTDAIGNLEALS